MKIKQVFIFDGENRIGKGVSCQVFNHPSDKSLVVKVYKDPDEAKSAFVLQKFFSKRKLSPPVEGLCTCYLYNDEDGGRTGLIVPKCNVLKQQKAQVCMIDLYKRNKLRGPLAEKMPSFMEAIDKWQLADIGWSNLAVYKGQPVVIDWGEDTTRIGRIRWLILHRNRVDAW